MLLDSYPYVTENNLDTIQTYQYSSTTLKVFGQGRTLFAQRCLYALNEFSSDLPYLRAYVEQTKQPIDVAGLDQSPSLESQIAQAQLIINKNVNQLHTNDILRSNLILALSGELSDEFKSLLTFFQRRFEVKKRLWSVYEKTGKAASQSYDNLISYALLAANLGVAVRETGDLRILNALLKVNDTVISLCDKMDEAPAWECAFIGIDSERHAMLNLCQKVLS